MLAEQYQTLLILEVITLNINLLKLCFVKLNNLIVVPVVNLKKCYQNRNEVKKRFGRKRITHDKTSKCHIVGHSSKKITDADADFLNSSQARSATGKSQLTNRRRI